MEAETKLKEAQKSSTEVLKNPKDDLKIKQVNVHKIIQQSMKLIDLTRSERQLEAQIYIEKAFGIRSDVEALKVSF